MKLIVFCLFAVWCSSLASTSETQTNSTFYMRKLEETRRHLISVRRSLQHNEQMKLSTPPRNIEDCCCLSALQCFRANLNVQFNVTENPNKRLYKSLISPSTERGLCVSADSGNVQSTCQDCSSHPKETAREFFNRLENLIQKAISRLNMQRDAVKISS